VFQRLLNFAVQSLPPDSRSGRRSKDIKDARPVRPLRRPVRVHHVGALVSALVARASNERHDPSYFRRPLPDLAGRAGFRAGFAAGRAGLAADFVGFEGFAGLTGLAAFFGFCSGAAGLAAARTPDGAEVS
jgi:hypothetical protein